MSAIPGTVSIVLKCEKYGDIYFTVNSATSFHKIFEAFNKKTSATDGDMKFLFDGQVIQENETPATFNMENDDEVDVIPTITEPTLPSANKTQKNGKNIKSTMMNQAQALQKVPSKKERRRQATKEDNSKKKVTLATSHDFTVEDDQKILTERAAARTFRHIGLDLGLRAMLVRNRHTALMRRERQQILMPAVAAGTDNSATDAAAAV